MSAGASSAYNDSLAFPSFQLPPELTWGRTFLVAQKVDRRQHFRCNSAPASLWSSENGSSCKAVDGEASSSRLGAIEAMCENSAPASSFGIGDTVAATNDFRIGGELAVEKGCRGTVICHGERPDGSIGVSIQFEAWKNGRDAHVLCQPREIEVVAKAPSADSFGIGDVVAAISDFCNSGTLVVQKECRGTVMCHGERPDGSIGVSVHFFARNDGSDAHVLCRPHKIQLVAKAPSADDFVKGDTVAATSDFCIGGALVVEKGCRGTVMCHGERPDGSRGVSIRFAARKDGRDAYILCRPHEIQAVADDTYGCPNSNRAPLLQHLGTAWETVHVLALSFCTILSSLPLQLMSANLLHARASDEIIVDRTTPPLQRQAVKKGVKPNDRLQKIKEASSEDDFDDLAYVQQHQWQQQRWSMVIVVLVLINLVLAYVHMQRSARKHDMTVVKVLTDGSLSHHIAAHPHGTLVNFFSSPCEPCAKLAPEFEAAAKRLHKTTNVSLVSVSAALAPTAFKQYLVRTSKRLPTLLWFRRGRLVRDVPESVQTVEQVVEFVHESLQPAVIEFRSHAEFMDAVPQLRTSLSKGKTPPIVVGFGSDPAVHDVLEQVAEKFRGETAFLFVPEAGDSDPCIQAFFRDSASDKEYKGSLKVDDLLTWLHPFMVE